MLCKWGLGPNVYMGLGLAIWLPWTSQVYIGAETNKGSQTAAQVLSHQLWLLLDLAPCHPRNLAS